MSRARIPTFFAISGYRIQIKTRKSNLSSCSNGRQERKTERNGEERKKGHVEVLVSVCIYSDDDQLQLTTRIDGKQFI